MKINIEDGVMTNPTWAGKPSIGDTQTLSAAGAVNLTQYHTNIVAGGAIALTLADGAEGQMKLITITTATGTATLTPTNLRSGASTTITFTAVGGSTHLLFWLGKWQIIGISVGAQAA